MGNKPTHIAYAVRNFSKSDGEPDSSWTRIGAAFIHKGGGGYDLVLDAIPVSGRIVLRLNKPKPKAAKDE